jgi:hypothetical protein
MLTEIKYLEDNYNVNIKGVIHVGAHHGEEINDYLISGAKKIVLFEPVEENYKILNENIEKYNNKNIIAYNVALGNFNGETFINLSTNDFESSSILNPKLHLSDYPNIKFFDKRKIILNKMDDYFNNFSDCNFLAIDTQGYELEVLRGGSKTLENIDYVYLEVNRAEVYENNAMVEDIDIFLNNYSMIRVDTNWAGGNWGDALYIRY